MPEASTGFFPRPVSIVGKIPAESRRFCERTHRAVETLLEQHEALIAAVADRRDEIATRTPARSGDHRRPAAASVVADRA